MTNNHNAMYRQQFMNDVSARISDAYDKGEPAVVIDLSKYVNELTSTNTVETYAALVSVVRDYNIEWAKSTEAKEFPPIVILREGSVLTITIQT